MGMLRTTVALIAVLAAACGARTSSTSPASYAAGDRAVAHDRPCTFPAKVHGPLRIATMRCRPSDGFGWHEMAVDPAGGAVLAAYGGSNLPEEHTKMFLVRVDHRLGQTWSQVVDRVEVPMGITASSGRMALLTNATYEGRMLFRAFDSASAPPAPSRTIQLEKDYIAFGLAEDAAGRLYTRVGDTHDYAVFDATGARIGGGSLAVAGTEPRPWSFLAASEPVTTRVVRSGSGRIAFAENLAPASGAPARLNIVFVDPGGSPPSAVTLQDGFHTEASELGTHVDGVVVASREVGIQPTRENLYPIPGRLSIALVSERGVAWTKMLDVPADRMHVAADARGFITLVATFEDHVVIGTDRVAAKRGAFIARLDPRGNLLGWVTIDDDDGKLANVHAKAVVVAPDGRAFIAGSAYENLWIATIDPP